MKSYYLILSIFSLIITSCDKNQSCEEKEKVYLYLTEEEKNWLAFATIDTILYDDSLANIKRFTKTYYKDIMAPICFYMKGQFRVEYETDSCPYRFVAMALKEPNEFKFRLQTGFISHNIWYCSSSFAKTSPSSFEPEYDSLEFRNRRFYNVYQFTDEQRTVYFTKENGIVAFTVDSIVWVQIP